MEQKTLVDLVGNTPLVRLQKLCPNPDVVVLAKLESQNPGGSVKDRPALSMIEGALQRGELTPGCASSNRPAATPVLHWR